MVFPSTHTILAGPLLASKDSKVLPVKLCHLYGISMHTPLSPMSFILPANFGGGWTSLSSFRATSCLARSHPIVWCHFRCAWSSPMVILNPSTKFGHPWSNSFPVFSPQFLLVRPLPVLWCCSKCAYSTPLMYLNLPAKFGSDWASHFPVLATSCLERSLPVVWCHFRCA